MKLAMRYQLIHPPNYGVLRSLFLGMICVNLSFHTVLTKLFKEGINVDKRFSGLCFPHQQKFHVHGRDRHMSVPNEHKSIIQRLLARYTPVSKAQLIALTPFPTLSPRAKAHSMGIPPGT
jgi:hypothetical protein